MSERGMYQGKGVVLEVTNGVLRRLGHVERMNGGGMTEKVLLSDGKGWGGKGGPKEG